MDKKSSPASHPPLKNRPERRSFVIEWERIGILNPEKPVLTLARLHQDVKVSARTTTQMTGAGVNLGLAMEQASYNFNGAGGGHNIAAGAMIPYQDLENFKNLVNDMVGSQISS